MHNIKKGQIFSSGYYYIYILSISNNVVKFKRYDIHDYNNYKNGNLSNINFDAFRVFNKEKESFIRYTLYESHKVINKEELLILNALHNHTEKEIASFPIIDKFFEKLINKLNRTEQPGIRLYFTQSFFNNLPYKNLSSSVDIEILDPLIINDEYKSLIKSKKNNIRINRMQFSAKDSTFITDNILTDILKDICKKEYIEPIIRYVNLEVYM